MRLFRIIHRLEPGRTTLLWGGPTLQGCRRGRYGTPAARSWLRDRRLRIEPRRSPDRAAALGAPPIRRVRQAKSLARRSIQYWAQTILSVCCFAAVFAAQPGFAQTAQTSPAA